MIEPRCQADNRVACGAGLAAALVLDELREWEPPRTGLKQGAGTGAGTGVGTDEVRTGTNEIRAGTGAGINETRSGRRESQTEQDKTDLQNKTGNHDKDAR